MRSRIAGAVGAYFRDLGTLWESALPATDLVLGLERLSRRMAEAVRATFLLVRRPIDLLLGIVLLLP